MNPETKNQKKISEYQIDDIKELFQEVFKKISSKIILLEIGNDFINIALAKSQKNRLFIKKVLRQNLPSEALDKSIPADPKSFGEFLKQLINENKIFTNRVAICLPSDACYTRLIDIPVEIEEENSISYIENPNSGIQIPISLENSDFEINLSNLPEKEIKNKIFNKYFLTSLPKKNVDLILDSFKSANLEICSIQMSHICIANLLQIELSKLDENNLIISIDLLDEFSQFVIFDRSGPLLIKRLASIRKYPSIDEIKEINKKKNEKNNKSNEKNNSNNYHALSKLDLKVLIREINESFNNFLNKNNLNKKGKIFLSGRNSQHKNLVEILGKSLKMDVSLISPINNPNLKEFFYNPDEINQFSMSRIIGLGLTLLKDNEIQKESSDDGFIAESFVFDEVINEEKKSNVLLKDINLEKIKNKDKFESKTKVEENKKKLPPLPNVKKIKGETKVEENKKKLLPLPNVKKIKGDSKVEENKKKLPPLPNIKKIKEETKVEENKKELPPLPNIKKIKEETKIEENKKELPPLPNIKKIKEETKIEENKKELPPLPNIKKIKENTQKNKKDLSDNEVKINKNLDKKKNNSFKIDKSFLKDD